MFGFKPNDYVEPKKTEESDSDFTKFRNERINLQSTEVQDAFRRYNRNFRSL